MLPERVGQPRMHLVACLCWVAQGQLGLAAPMLGSRQMAKRVRSQAAMLRDTILGAEQLGREQMKLLAEAARMACYTIPPRRAKTRTPEEPKYFVGRC